MWFPPPPPPVSYSHEVARIFALHCNGCHGGAGGLSTRTYAELMVGGNKGRVVLAGNPEGSLLLHFIEGKRGPNRRMPPTGPPLPPESVARIRQWIAEGAVDDKQSVAEQRVQLPIELPAAGPLRLQGRCRAEAYLTLRVTDPATGRVLHEESGAVKQTVNDTDFGKPGAPLRWTLRRGSNWPKAITAEIIARYAEGDAALELTAFE